MGKFSARRMLCLDIILPNSNIPQLPNFHTYDNILASEWLG